MATDDTAFDDRPLLLKAFNLAGPHVEADRDTPEIVTDLLADNADPLRVLSHAVWQLADRLHQFYAPIGDIPAVYRCGWCIQAAGDTKESWDAAQVLPNDAMKAHTLICEHNPLVVRIKELVLRIEELEQQAVTAPGPGAP